MGHRSSLPGPSLFCLILAAGSIAASLHLVIDNSIEAYFMNDDPSFAYYKKFTKEYGNDEFLYIVYTHKNRGVFPESPEKDPETDQGS